MQVHKGLELYKVRDHLILKCVLKG
jgi:hypothetical protein